MNRIVYLICAMIVLSALTSCGMNQGDVAMMKGASSEISAMCIYKFDEEDTFTKWIYDQQTEDKVIAEINQLAVRPVEKEMLAKWKEPCYGITMWNKEGDEIALTYSDGLWLVKDGTVYAAQYDLPGLYEGTEAQETVMSHDGMPMPNAFILSQYSLKYYGKTDPDNVNENIHLSFVDENDFVVTVRLENLTDEEQYYSYCFSLEKEIDGCWYKVPVAVSDYAFFSVGIVLPAKASQEETCDLTIYGHLEPGHYRIEKENAYAEFFVDGAGFSG